VWQTFHTPWAKLLVQQFVSDCTVCQCNKTEHLHCRPLISKSPRCICTCARIMHKYAQNQHNWYTAKKKGSELY
jgi:hypothetical protein